MSAARGVEEVAVYYDSMRRNYDTTTFIICFVLVAYGRCSIACRLAVRLTLLSMLIPDLALISSVTMTSC